MRLVRWKCGAKLTVELPDAELRKRRVLEEEDIVIVLRRNDVLLNNDVEWVKNCICCEAEDVSPRDRPN